MSSAHYITWHLISSHQGPHGTAVIILPALEMRKPKLESQWHGFHVRVETAGKFTFRHCSGYFWCPGTICLYVFSTNMHYLYNFYFLIFIYLFEKSFFCVFLGPHLRHMEVPRLGVESELQLLSYTTAHSNPGSLTHYERPGVESSPSWMLVGFVTQ